jgi:hypothetical protein
MLAGRGRQTALRAGFALALLALGVGDGGAAPAGRAAPDARRTERRAERVRPTPARPAWRGVPWRRALPPPPADRPVETPPRGFLIYLIDGDEPILTDRYVEEPGQIAFEKYGGWIRIPTYEILRIVPDHPDPADRTVNLPPPSAAADTGGAPLAPAPELYVTMRGGSNLRVAGFTPEGDQVRVTVPHGSFVVPRSEIVSVVRVPKPGDVPEAWLSVLVTDGDDSPAAPASSGLVPPSPAPRLPYAGSDRPHYVRLQNGQLLRVDGFWVEDGEFRFRRLGGIVGVALGEVARLFPDEIAPVRGRTPVRFARQLTTDLLEVDVRSGPHRVRLVGVRSVDGADANGHSHRTPPLEPGAILYLEFDRQRYDAEGNWLAYVFLPNGRMLNAELVRLGLARPAPDGRNARYLDLFHEMAGGAPPAAEGPDPD